MTRNLPWEKGGKRTRRGMFSVRADAVPDRRREPDPVDRRSRG